MHASQVAGSRVEPVNLKAHETTCLAEGEFCKIYGRSWSGCPEGLHNFWEEQLTATQNCEISGLSCSVGPYCTIFLRKVV